MADRNVPGHTQLTRMPSRAYSTAATLASWITAALVAQYGAACDHAVSPDTDAVSTIEPDCCVRMTGTAARMPLTAPRTLMRKARSQSSVDEVVDAAVRREHAGVADQHVEPAEALDGPRDDGLDLGDVADVGQHRLDRAVDLGQAADGRVERRLADVAQHEVGVGLARRSGADRAAPSAPPAPLMTTTRRVIRAGTPRRR